MEKRERDLFTALMKADEMAGNISPETQENVQKEIISQYEDNAYLKSAREGHLSIREAYESLDEKLRGIKRILPAKKDKHHNAAVEILGELIPTEHLKTRGLLAWDNYAMGTAVTIGVMYGFSYLMEFTDAGQNLTSNNVPFFLGLLLSPWTGYLVGQEHRAVHGINVKYGMSARACADYLDTKLVELGFAKKPEQKVKIEDRY